MTNSMSETLARALDGLPRSGRTLPDGSVSGGAAVPSSRVPENLIHMLEEARRGLDDDDFDTVGAEMSVHWHSATGAADIAVLLRPQTGEKS